MATAKSRRIMGKDKLEKLFHSHLSDHEIRIDTQDLWGAIQAELPPKERSNGYLWLGLMALIGALIFSWSIYSFNTHSTTTATTTVKDKDLASSSNKQNEEKALNKLSASPIFSDDEAESKIDEKENSSADRSKKIKSTTTEQKVVASNPSLYPATEGALSDVHTKTEAANIQQKSQIENNTRVKVIDDSGHSLSQSRTQGLTFDQLVERAVKNKGTEEVIVRFEERPYSPELQLNTPTESFKSENIARTKWGILEELPYLNIDPLAQEGVNLVKSDYEDGLSDCYDFRNWNWAWSLDLYAGMHYAQKTLKEIGSNVSNSDLQNYKGLREDTENLLEAFEGGAAVNLMHRSGYMMSLGINYSQINERFQWIRESNFTRFDSVVVSVSVDSLGMRDSTREWQPVTVRLRDEVTTYNTYRQIDIPIGVGYQFFNGKWIYEVQAGAMFNILFQQKGQIINELGDIDEIGDEEIFRTKVGFSAWAGVKVMYPLSKRLSLYAEPNVRFNLQPVTAEGYSLEQKYHRYGLRVGARINF